MTPELWHRVQLLFEEALAWPAHGRAAFVESACGDEAEVLHEVTALLRAAGDDDAQTEIPSTWLDALWGNEAPRFAPGDRVAERYQIRRLLGRGGMGKVYEAWDDELSIEVALKTLHLAGASEESRKRLQLEGLLARSIWHPNVCRLYDLGRHHGSDDDVWFLTMEILRGDTLGALLEQAGALPFDRAQRLAEQMAAGLGAAHRAGVVHRDFKPGNVILIAKEGREQAVVTDFGIARAQASDVAHTDVEEARAIVGTPAYMAPEQLRGEAVGPTADIYALGVVLHEMLTGALPLDTPSPRHARPEIDARWESVILRCLERDPARRFQRAEEVIQALAGTRAIETCEGPERIGPEPHSLPPERDAFVGREPELMELERNLSSARLVTLVGPGGMGKTRLSVRFGWRTLAAWPGGVWFCDLTDARDESSIALAVARSLGVELRQSDPIEQLGHAIAGRGRCLVILDNFEQVVEHALATVGRWLSRPSEAKLLVTSRQRLGIESTERVQRAESLSPEAGLALFKIRTRWLRPDFDCTGAEANAARELVRLVDGMPLAIELAAARIRVMSATQIVQQMQRRFALLTGGANARHETLAGAIDGSWELLTEWERSAWAQLSVFEGGFTLEAAEALLAFDRPGDRRSVTDLLRSLVDKSLLRTSITWLRGGRSSLRFGMLVSLQEYARMKLRDPAGDGAVDSRESLESESAVLDRHGEWFARLGEAGDPLLTSSTGLEGWISLEAELANLVLAVNRAVRRGDGRIAAAAYRGAVAVLSRNGPFSVLVQMGRDVLHGTELEDATRASVLLGLGGAEVYAGETGEAEKHLDAGLALFRARGDRGGECAALTHLARLLLLLGRSQDARLHAEAAITLSREIGARRLEGAALGFLSEINYAAGQTEEARRNGELALTIARELGDGRAEASNLINLGVFEFDDARLAEVARYFEAALRISREVGARTPQGVALGNLGHLCQGRGQLDQALTRFQEALTIHREVGYRRYEGVTLGDLGNLHRERGEMDEARGYLEAALAIQREVGNRMLEGAVLGDLGLLHFECGRTHDARTCYEAALAIDRQTQNQLLEGVALHRLGALDLAEDRIAEARAALSESESKLRSFGDLFEIAKLLCTRADLELTLGDRDAATSTLAEAESLATKTESGPGSELGRAVSKLRAKLDRGN